MSATATAPASTPEVRQEAKPIVSADSAAIIKRYSMWAAGAGVLPLPLIDMVLISGIQVKMVYELSKAHKLPFSESRAKALIGSLIGSVVPYGVVGTSVVGGLASLLKAVPVVGPLITFTFCPALASASTYAVGRVFAQHFETGGTLLSFDAEKMRAFFRKEYDAARDVFDKDDSNKPAASADKAASAKPANT